MKKYIVALYRMITADKWLVVSIKNECNAGFTSSGITTGDCYSISNELTEMAVEIKHQEALLRDFKNN